MSPALLADHPGLWAWVILPFLIFLARTVDMGLSTLRVVSISQGRAGLAAVIGFFESTIWLLVIGQILPRLDNPVCVVAYAAGFAAGNLVGLRLERRLKLGLQIVRVITREDAGPLAEELREQGWGVTRVEGQGASGAVTILFAVVRRRDVETLVETVRRTDPRAFFSIEDVRRVEEGFFPPPGPWPFPVPWDRALRKSR